MLSTQLTASCLLCACRRGARLILLLWMVATITELHVGIAMPSSTAALCETAVDAMLKRAGVLVVSGSTKALLPCC